MTHHAKSIEPARPACPSVDFGRALSCVMGGLVGAITGRQDSPPTYQSTVELIEELHRDEWDSAFNVPYSQHPVRAAEKFQILYPQATDEEIQAVLLHDTIENGCIEAEDLLGLGYSMRTLDIVEHLTKLKKIAPKPTNEEIIQGIIDTGDIASMYAKLADALDNRGRQMTGRLALSDPERYNLIIPKHTETITMLCAALGEDVDDVLARTISPETGFADVVGFNETTPA